MDLGKFMDLLNTESLYFVSPKNLQDPFEGKFPHSNIKKVTPGLKTRLREIESRAQDIQVNCWNKDKTESIALWNAYVKHRGIAIQSTVKKLQGSLKKESKKDIEMGLINYLSHHIVSIEKGFVYDVVSYKREYFEFEKELRLFHMKKSNTKKEDNYVKVDLDILIDKIILYPNSPPWYRKTIEGILTAYELDFLISRIHYSELDEDPPL